MGLVELARKTHRPFVAECTFHGTIGRSPSLYVYAIKTLPGDPYIQTRPMPLNGTLSTAAASQTVATVAGFAQFFAASWKHPQVLDPTQLLHVRREYEKRVDLLVTGLPPRFTEKLKMIQLKLDRLFTSPYPLVLNHGDLCEMNILADPETGRLTSVIDWESVCILPFGMSLWGLENSLGWMDSAGWHYYINRDVLVCVFWDTFNKELAATGRVWDEGVPKSPGQSKSTEDSAGTASDPKLKGEQMKSSEGSQKHGEHEHVVADKDIIMIARLLGIFCRYGFAWNKGAWEVATAGDGDRLRYLDALINTSL